MLLAAVMVGSVGASVHLTLPISLVSDLLPPQHATYDSPTTLSSSAAVNGHPTIFLPLASSVFSDLC